MTDQSTVFDRCSHSTTALRRRVQQGTGKTLCYVMQCQTCGNQIENVRKDSAVIRALTAPVPEVDPELQKRFYEMRARWWDRKREREDHERREQYAAYLQSEEWRTKRRIRLNLDNGACQAMLDGCQGRAAEVHHLTYDHLYDEPIFDLISVCSPCHRRLSEREGRIKAA